MILFPYTVFPKKSAPTLNLTSLNDATPNKLCCEFAQSGVIVGKVFFIIWPIILTWSRVGVTNHHLTVFFLECLCQGI